MLYVDSSALIKYYIREVGTDALNAKLNDQSVRRSGVFISVLGYAEVLATFARRLRENPRLKTETARISKQLEYDWTLNLNGIELDVRVLLQIPRLVSNYPLKGSDAIHLASALSLRDALKIGAYPLTAGPLTVATSDRQLKTAVLAEGLGLFDPESIP